MKLAEALLLRSDLQTKLASLQQRINNNVLIQEGDELSEDPNALMGDEAFSVNTELHHLIEKIHATNAQAKTSTGQSMLSVLNTRDLLTQQHRIIQQAIDSSRRENGRYSSSEIRWVKTIAVADLQKQADAISQQLRQNNLEIQASNWQIELI